MIAYEELDNGVLSCTSPKRLQEIADGLTHNKIEALLRKWHAILPQPFSAQDVTAGYILRSAKSETFERSHVSPERGSFPLSPRTLARCSYASHTAARGIAMACRSCKVSSR